MAPPKKDDLKLFNNKLKDLQFILCFVVLVLLVSTLGYNLI